MNYVDKLEPLWRMGPRERIKHWAGAQPWKNATPRRIESILPADVQTDNEGAIVRSPLNLARPCFGEPAAYARHARKPTFYNPRVGKAQKTRCGRCPMNDACHSVAKKRIKGSRDLLEKFRAFDRKGGWLGLERPKEFPSAKAAFASFVRALLRHGGFASVNDQAVLEYYANRRVERLRVDAERKRNERRGRIQAGMLDAAAVEVIRRHAIYRQSLLQQLLDDAELRRQLPRTLNRLTDASPRLMAHVWACREELEARKQDGNPSAIASLMIARWPARYSNQNALRQRVPGDLDRIALLKHPLPTHAEPLWPPFNLVEVVMEEEAEITPYAADDIKTH